MQNIETYFLNTLLRPAQVIERISEQVELQEGVFSTNSTIEYDVPSTLRQKKHLMIPIVFRGKDELTRELMVTSPPGFSLRRLNDSELVELLVRSLSSTFTECGWPQLDTSVLREVARFAIALPVNDSEDDFVRSYQGIIKSAEIDNDDQEAMLASLFLAMRSMKPICYAVEWAEWNDQNCSRLKLLVSRKVALVPIRRHGTNIFINTYLKLKRLFTKRRMNFYFGLGNADCSKSYHLSLVGSQGTYLTGMQFKRIGKEDEFFICEDICINSRHDQSATRIYIKQGRGFSRAALSLTFDRRSQRPVATLLVTSVACLLVSIQSYFEFRSCESATGVFQPITILSIGVLVSSWQAMEEYRAEEILWICNALTALSSFASVLLLVCKGEVANWLGMLSNLVWGGCLTAHFVSAFTSGLATFTKVKLHGLIMDKVPRVRRVPEFDLTSRYRYSFVEFLKKQKEIYDSGASILDRRNISVRQTYPKQFFDYGYGMSRETRYLNDIGSYRSLFSEDWPDGWLMPVWSSAMNPFRLPSQSFYQFAESVIARKEGADNDL